MSDIGREELKNRYVSGFIHAAYRNGESGLDDATQQQTDLLMGYIDAYVAGIQQTIEANAEYARFTDDPEHSEQVAVALPKINKAFNEAKAKDVNNMTVPQSDSTLDKQMDAFFARSGFIKHANNYRGRGLYFSVGGYDITRNDAKAIYNIARMERDTAVAEVLEHLPMRCHNCGTRTMYLEAHLRNFKNGCCAFCSADALMVDFATIQAERDKLKIGDIK